VTLQQWLDQWKHKSPQVQARVQTALDFLQKHYGKEPDKTRRENKILGEIKCIDFSKSVSLPTMTAATRLVGVKDPRKPPDSAVYFTKSGHPASRLGIATEGALPTDPRVLDKALYRYEVVTPIPAGEILESTCAPAADTWSIVGQKVLADGGGLQYLIPNMNRYLRYVP
jgi:Bacterial toxin 46